MIPNLSQVVEPEAKKANKVETKPVLNTVSENKPSNVGSNIIATIKFKCTVDNVQIFH